MNHGSDDEARSPVPSFLHPGFWEDVDREIDRLDPSDLALFEAAGRMPSSARDGYRAELLAKLTAPLRR